MSEETRDQIGEALAAIQKRTDEREERPDEQERSHRPVVK